jgi:hypothetical protein
MFTNSRIWTAAIYSAFIVIITVNRGMGNFSINAFIYSARIVIIDWFGGRDTTRGRITDIISARIIIITWLTSKVASSVSIAFIFSTFVVIVTNNISV